MIGFAFDRHTTTMVMVYYELGDEEELFYTWLTNQIRILILESGIALNSPQIQRQAGSLHGVG